MATTTTPKRPVGRPATHGSPAARAAAYRARKAQQAQEIATRLAAAEQQAAAAPKVVEKIVERIVEKRVSRGGVKVKGVAYDASLTGKRISVTHGRFENDKWQGEENARALQRNLKIAKNTLESIRTIIVSDPHLASDVALIDNAQFMLSDFYNGAEGAVFRGKSIKAKAERDAEERRKQDRINALKTLFGTETPAPEEVQSLAGQLAEFEDHGEEWLLKRHPAAKDATFYAGCTRIRHHLADRHLAVVLADAFNETSKKGSLGMRDEEPIWRAGWDDFEAWRKAAQ